MCHFLVSQEHHSNQTLIIIIIEVNMELSVSKECVHGTIRQNVCTPNSTITSISFKSSSIYLIMYLMAFDHTSSLQCV